MTIIHTYLTPAEVKRLSQRDNDYLRGKLEAKCLLNDMLHKRTNKPLLAELRCVLDNRILARRKTEYHRKDSEVRVYSANGVLVRVENSKGKVMKIV